MLILRPIVTTAKYYLNHFRGGKNKKFEENQFIWENNKIIKCLLCLVSSCYTVEGFMKFSHDDIFYSKMYVTICQLTELENQIVSASLYMTEHFAVGKALLQMLLDPHTTCETGGKSLPSLFCGLGT